MSHINIDDWNNKIEIAFNKAKECIPEYENELKMISDVLTKGLNIDERVVLEKRQTELSLLIEDLMNDTSFGFYLMEAQSFLELKGTNILSFMKKDRIMENPKLVSLSKSFLELIGKYNDILKLDIPQVSNQPKSNVVCSCGNVKEFDIIDKRVYNCLRCGIQIKENVGTRSVYRDTERVNVNGKYKYTRMIHFKNCFRQYQGKQKTTISQECLSDVKEQLRINGIKSKKINPRHIRVALQETGWNEHYENFVLIWSLITNKPCPDISEFEEIISQDFQLIERTYNEILGDPKEERSSFMSYPYVLYQLLLRRDVKCDLNFFNMLKSDRVVWLDGVMEQIYFKLEWGGFTPVV